MKFFFTAIFLFFSTLAFAEKPLITIKHWDLSNKTRVFFVRRTELPMLDIQLVFAAGSSRDGDTPGLATLTNALIGEGAATISAKQISKNLENEGEQF